MNGKTWKIGIAAALWYICLVCPVQAADLSVTLTAERATQTMPDMVNIPVWRYRVGLDPGGITTGGLPGSDPVIISAQEGDVLTITLVNSLSAEPTSIVINGQPATETGALTPVWTDDTSGPRTNNSQRVRSFTHEAGPSGGPGSTTAVYEWGGPSGSGSGLNAGTYLVQSGTHPAVQVPMGLIAVLKVDAVAGSRAYTGTPNIDYDSETVLFFSEIDPTLNAAVDTGTFGTPFYPSAIDYDPVYYLLNGKPFLPSDGPLATVAIGDRLLVRVINAGIKTHVPVLYGARLSLVAQDGRLLPASSDQYSINLPALKTKDALVVPTVAGYPRLFDRIMPLTLADSPGGGTLAYLEVQSATTYQLNVATTGNGTVTSAGIPGGIDCGTTCSGTYNQDAALSLSATPWTGWLFGRWTGDCTGSPGCSLTMDAAKNVTAEFLDVTRDADGDGIVNGTDTCVYELPAKIDAGTTHASLAFAAANAAAPFDIVKIHGGIMAEVFDMNQPTKTLTFAGGYVCDHSTVGAVGTTIQGSLAVSQGVAIINGITIQ